MNHLLKAWICFFLLSLSLAPASAQQKEIIVFYNVENFFDTKDDPFHMDEEFTTGGAYCWDTLRYIKKQRNIYKVLAAIGQWSPPAVICLAEIENRKVAADLLKQTPLLNGNYKIIHFDSRDERGMDVALLYRESVFCCDTSFVVPVYFEADRKSSRDILFVKGKMHGKPVCIVVNHWPSRRGGIAASEKYRLHASELLLKHLGMLLDSDPDLPFVITGDFNDEPANESLQMLLKKTTAVNLQALPYHYSEKVKGTIKYKGAWFAFDQFVVTANMLKENAALSVHQKKANIFEAAYLLKQEKKQMGYKPYRTYMGSYYTGGFSDHLPVFIEVNIN